MTKTTNRQQQQQVRKNNQAKKCHGRRRLQRLRRRYRSKGMNDEAIAMLLELHRLNRSTLSAHAKAEEKNIRNSSLMNSFNPISGIASLLVQKNQILNGINQPRTTNADFPVGSRRSRKRYNMSTDHWKQIRRLIPDYKQLSSCQFQQLLLKEIPYEYYAQIERLLDNVTSLEYIRQRTELLSVAVQLTIEEHYCHYRGSLNLPLITWLLQVSNDVIQQNFINWDRTKTPENISRRQQIICRQLEQAEMNLIKHFQAIHVIDWHIPDGSSLRHMFEIIHQALTVVVCRSLYYLYINFEQKKLLLYFDLYDAYLVKSFYDLNPTPEQMITVQKIWRTNVKSAKKLLHEKKKQKPNESSSVMDITQQFTSYSSLELFNDVKMRTIIQTRQSNIHQRTQQMLKFTNTIENNPFFRS